VFFLGKKRNLPEIFRRSTGDIPESSPGKKRNLPEISLGEKREIVSLSLKC
jgi:hypothetical protein